MNHRNTFLKATRCIDCNREPAPGEMFPAARYHYDEANPAVPVYDGSLCPECSKAPS